MFSVFRRRSSARAFTPIKLPVVRTKLLFVALFLFSTVQANACSVCIAHAIGAALHGIGAQTLPNGQLVIGLSYLTFGKSNGTGTPGERENEDYSQVSLDFSKGLTDRLMLRGSIPFVDKAIQVTGQPRETAHGLGDVSLGLLYQLPPDIKGKFLTAFNLDLKLPTGANNDRDSTGVLKDQHLQVGTGSTDISAGVALTWEGKTAGELWFAGLRGRVNTENSRHYRFGNALFYDFGYMHPVGNKGAAVIEFNGRFAEKDTTEDGTKDDDSGGHLGYISLSYRHELSRDFGVIVTYQQPIIKNLNGTQDEKPLISFSLTKTF
jgi:hypothetical protein